MNVLKQSAYLSEQFEENDYNATGLRFMMPVLSVIASLFFILCLWALYMNVVTTFLGPPNTMLMLLAGLCFAFFVAFSSGAIATRQHWRAYRNRAANFAQGIAGEEALLRLLRDDIKLGDEWTLLRNVVLPGRKDDIDAVLLGPGGIFALEVKALTGRHRYADNRWFKQSKWGRGQFEIKQHPGKQAYGNAKRLEAFLQEKGLRGDVIARLVWTKGYLRVEKGYTPVWFLSQAEKISAELHKTITYTQAQLQAIKLHLT